LHYFQNTISISIHSACGGTLDVFATVIGLWMFWFAKGWWIFWFAKVVVILTCKGSSSDLVRHEPNSIEMRCDKTLNVLALRDAM
jgi:hypothetical protein